MNTTPTESIVTEPLSSSYEVAPYGDVSELLTGSTTRYSLIRTDLTVIEDLSLKEALMFAASTDGLAAAKFALSVLQANPVEMSERMAIEKLQAFIANAETRS